AADPHEATSPVAHMVVETHDFSSAISAHVASSKLPAEAARKNAIQQLMAPFAANGMIVKHEEVEPGKFQVVTTKQIHDELRGVAEWMANGEKQIVITTRIISIPESTLKQIHRQFNPRWEMSVDENDPTIVGRLPKPQKPSGVPISFASFNKSKTVPVSFAMSKTVSSLPCRFAKIVSPEMQQVVQQQQANSTSNIMQAPKVTLFPGQFAEIKDCTQRPFVVSVKPVREGDAVAMQPIIKVLTEGLEIGLKCTVEDEDEVHLESRIAFSQIGKVDTFTFGSADDGTETTVQIPEHHMKQVQVANDLAAGESLLIDPHFFTTKTTKRRFRSDLVTRDYILVVLTPEVITQTVEVE
ncbi:MAG: hypothetical protein AAF497_23350, partial [Planctomycetota bacterium]